MTRPLPALAPNSALLPAQRQPLLEADLHLVTPAFGGGALPGEPDRDDPVRVATVRGHLRFWWRACNAARFADPRQLFEAEAAIWGRSADAGNDRFAPSAVDVSVSILDPGRLRPCAARENDRGRERLVWQVGRPNEPLRSLSYVLWPFVQGEGGGAKDPALVREGLKFRLSFTLAARLPPERAAALRKEIEAALWAWVAFGGLGARTRRGCGALFSPSFSPSGDAVQALRQRAERYVAAGDSGLKLPSLHGARLLLGRAEAPLAAWNRTAGWLQRFRQGDAPARNQGGRGDGRPQWPEPEAVRRLLRLPSPRRAPAGPTQPYFPRADLGLPILFQRMAGGTHTLEADAPSGRRFASPVVLKPLAVGPDRALPLLLAFNAPHLWDLAGATLDGQRIPPAQLYDPAASAAVPPLRGHPTAREAFLASVREQGAGTQVTL